MAADQGWAQRKLARQHGAARAAAAAPAPSAAAPPPSAAVPPPPPTYGYQAPVAARPWIPGAVEAMPVPAPAYQQPPERVLVMPVSRSCQIVRDDGRDPYMDMLAGIPEIAVPGLDTSGYDAMQGRPSPSSQQAMHEAMQHDSAEGGRMRSEMMGVMAPRPDEAQPSTPFRVYASPPPQVGRGATLGTVALPAPSPDLVAPPPPPPPGPTANPPVASTGPVAPPAAATPLPAPPPAAPAPAAAQLRLL